MGILEGLRPQHQEAPSLCWPQNDGHDLHVQRQPDLEHFRTDLQQETSDLGDVLLP